MIGHLIKHGLGTRDVFVTVIDDNGYALVFDTTIVYDNEDECTVFVEKPGRHRVVITDGEQSHAEWLEF